jgi:hypothetical protein
VVISGKYTLPLVTGGQGWMLLSLSLIDENSYVLQIPGDQALQMSLGGSGGGHPNLLFNYKLFHQKEENP